MPSGLKIPIEPDKHGRAKIVEGSEYIKQIIKTALSDCSSLNPFQTLGLGNKMIFDINDNRIIAKLTIQIEEMFAKLEMQELAKLAFGSVSKSLIFEQTKEGELDLTIKYIDLETNQPKEIKLTI